ncbi:UNVERIFIED_CONTAM: hypothetical protein HDU68_005701, partial [Siphonaria sp. JEL0065]
MPTYEKKTTKTVKGGFTPNLPFAARTLTTVPPLICQTKTTTSVDGAKKVETSIKTIYKLIETALASRPRPQDDFYTFANFEWLNDENITIPSEYSTWGSFQQLRDESLKNQIKLLQEIISAESATIDEAKLGAVWKASINRFSDWSAGKGSLAPVVDAIAVIDSHLSENTDAALARYLAYSQQVGIETPFVLAAFPDFADSNKNALAIGPFGGLSLPSRDFYFEENFKEKRELFNSHLGKVAALVGGLDADFAAAVLRFETKLAYINMKSEQGREFTQFYTATTLDGFVENVNELKALEDKIKNYEASDSTAPVVSADERARIASFMNTFYDKLNVREQLKANHAKHYPDVSEPSEKVNAFDGDFFRRFFTTILFNDSNREDLRAYLQYHAIRAAGSYCTKELDDEFFDFYSRKLSGQKEPKSAEKRTVDLINDWIGFLLGKVYVARHFARADKDTVNGMIEEVVKAMEASWKPTTVELYDELVFQDGDSLWEMKKRVAAFNFQDEFMKELNAPVDKTKWQMTPQTVNAYYSPLSNEICFPAAIVQSPFYARTFAEIDFKVDKAERALVGNDDIVAAAANFGGIAAVIAHEINHGFYDQGRNFDSDGNLRDLWTEEDGKLFDSK